MSTASLLGLYLIFRLASTLDVSGCSCGYFDPSFEQLYTESIIVYFNESQTLPDQDFSPHSYVHRSEKGWNSLYRQGASPSNVLIGNESTVSWLEQASNPSSLQLFVDPSANEHLVTGAAVETKRQDIQYGTFRASMRSPHPWAGGSALSMMLRYNESQSLEIDMLNTDKPSTARVTTLMNGEWPAQSLGVNYTTMAEGSADVPPVSPWDFMEVRLDWARERINFTVAGNLTRSVGLSQQDLPTTPSALIFKHWSTGDTYFMQGPPVNRSAADVAWVRVFFNSSLMSDDEHRDFDSQCQPSMACSVDDINLRGASAYPGAALVPWKEPPRNEAFRIPAAIVAGACAFFGFFALMNAFVRRTPWHKLLFKAKSERLPVPPVLGGDSKPTEELEQSEKRRVSASESLSDTLKESKRDTTYSDSSNMLQNSSMDAITPVDARLTATPSTQKNFTLDSAVLMKKLSQANFSDASTIRSPESKNTSARSSALWSAGVDTCAPPTPKLPVDMIPRFTGWEYKGSRLEDEPEDGSRISKGSSVDEASSELSDVSNRSSGKTRGIPESEKEIPAPALLPDPAPTNQISAPKKRIDYLAGLVAFSCVCVTFVHFVLTFLPYAVGIGRSGHYKSEYWARWTAGPYILTPIWIGPFFTTSCRFLITRFLRDGNLSDVANKMLLRAPRMLIPPVIIAMLEYFFIEQGLTNMLQWLPSITWSSWPYVQNYPNFGYFLNEILELGYLIPNAAPRIVAHYCVGVLWTIPVQLQFSYTTLIGAVMIRDIRTPWKRFSFYAFCIVNHWYALSWGSCFWLGLLLADLDITYKSTKWIQTRPRVHYPLLTLLWIVTIAAPTWFLLDDHFGTALLTRERGIHPDVQTGLPLSQTPRAGYPDYFEPRLNTLIFAGSLQMIVELSTWVQKFLSLKVWIWVFPHIMTVYLIHGFIFWSLGAWLCVTLAEAGLPYWANMLVVWTCCYAAMAVASILITPMTEPTAMAACRNIWRWASEQPVPKRPTLAPFPKDLFLNRAGKSAAASGDVESIAEVRTDRTAHRTASRVEDGLDTADAFVAKGKLEHAPHSDLS
ncbi:hypothetical protein H2201_008815 [Coniosporium apollinis]|uniref:GH16 domain-containing protein n=1 Tax=Coniosporium apollinis TaxID=61459 RepID=A0ABQ9NIR1_9PEZI|nr:hypothetical protein H2201_008815 [Coniosporium apollinis]